MSEVKELRFEGFTAEGYRLEAYIDFVRIKGEETPCWVGMIEGLTPPKHPDGAGAPWQMGSRLNPGSDNLQALRDSLVNWAHRADLRPLIRAN